MERPPLLELLFEYHATLNPPVVVGQGPFGMRQIFDINGGEVRGERLRGRILPSGADWILVGADNVGRLDVRGTIETHDGAYLYMSYFGLLRFDEAVMQAVAGGPPTAFGETFFFSNPRIETGDPRYEWINSTFLVGQGRVAASRVEYRIYQLT